MRKVEFVTDFANKSKGDILLCDSMLASHLVNIDKVAEYVVDEADFVPKAKKK